MNTLNFDVPKYEKEVMKGYNSVLENVPHERMLPKVKKKTKIPVHSPSFILTTSIASVEEVHEGHMKCCC